LYALRYPAVGSRELALKVAQLLEVAGMSSSFDERRGLDHGAWVPLMHLYPDADVPVVPISLPASLSPEGLWKLGEALSSLADEGVLIVGSGGLTHNLYEVRMNADQEAPYARAFVQWAREAVRVRDRAALTGFATAAPETRRAHPTAEHFLPLLFAAGAGQHRPDVTVLEGGTLYHVLSMESYVFTEASTTPVAA
jgi:4,5-DOPA dioxygenase extradiol